MTGDALVHAAPVPDRPDAARLAGLDDMEKIRYRDVDDVTDAGIGLHGGLGVEA
ncbi:hypothetical protein [Streptomyces sp. NPDC093260]|uniref:hypothetical protein n=1 Tax=Streptomyces sp. NPDC093260 TaxID=3155073 RepID=UPI003432540D